MRASIRIALVCLAATVATGCSSYSRYEHEQQIAAERNGRWTDEEREWRRDRARRDVRERRTASASSPTRRPPSTRTAVAAKPDASVASAHREPAPANAAPPVAAPSRIAAQPPVSRPPAAPPPGASTAAPAAASGAAVAAAAKPAAAEPLGPALIAARKEIADGYRLLRAGFVKKARERFDAAMTAAAGEATLGHGRSMDPSYLKGVAFPDAEPDVEEARKLYRRAILLGTGEAKSDLERLESATATAQPPAAPETPVKPGG